MHNTEMAVVGDVWRTTKVLTAEDIASIVRERGLERVLDELIERLRDALMTFDPEKLHSPIRQGFHYEQPEVGLLEWMPAMELGRVVVVKTVGYHPRNPTGRALPSVMATSSVYDTATGQLLAVLDATLLTALRTGAASAIATDILAVADPVEVAVVGCGAQAVTQLHAISRVRPIERVVAYDTDPRVAASFARRISFLDRPATILEADARGQLLAGVDVLCTCTSVDVGRGPVVQDGPHRPWLHINAIGADFPGKQELPVSLLERSLLCADLPEQCRVEGESQWVGPDALGPDLPTLVKEWGHYESCRPGLTVFDSTGWALEDMVAAELCLDLAAAMGAGVDVPLQRSPLDPHDPYALVGR